MRGSKGFFNKLLKLLCKENMKAMEGGPTLFELTRLSSMEYEMKVSEIR